jgi:hypothetical protein
MEQCDSAGCARCENRCAHDCAGAERLVKRLAARELTLSFVPDAEQRLWRTVTRRKYQLRRDHVRLQNQLESLLEEAHIKLSTLVTDLLGVSARRMLQALADGETNPAEGAVYRSSGPSLAGGCSPDNLPTRVASSVNWADPLVKRNSLCRRNQRKSTLANRFAKRIEAKWFATVRSVSRSSAISGSSSAQFALYLSLASRVISPRLSRASKDGCSTEKDVRLSIDP